MAMYTRREKWIAVGFMSGCAAVFPGAAYPTEEMAVHSMTVQDDSADKAQETLAIFHLEGNPAAASADSSGIATLEPDAASATVAHAGTSDSSAQSSIQDWVAVDSTVLEQMRGGFDIAPGLKISFGIERVVNLNGALQTAIRIEIPDASKLVQAQQSSAVSPTAGPAPSTPAVTPASASIAAPATPTALAAPATPIASAAPATPIASAAPATPTASAAPAAQASAASLQVATNLGNGAATLIQHGPGNTFAPGLLAQAAGATFIQNSVNNQTIQSVTIINAATNSLELLKGANLQSTLFDALTQFAGTR
ncbi:hypothetical protein [Noviherbaspirillum sedimenti]|nr:hypothetical protein [Noviherbaspirillum sedimenti]